MVPALHRPSRRPPARRGCSTAPGTTVLASSAPRASAARPNISNYASGARVRAHADLLRHPPLQILVLGHSRGTGSAAARQPRVHPVETVETVADRPALPDKWDDYTEAKGRRCSSITDTPTRPGTRQVERRSAPPPLTACSTFLQTMPYPNKDYAYRAGTRSSSVLHLSTTGRATDASALHPDLKCGSLNRPAPSSTCSISPSGRESPLAALSFPNPVITTRGSL